MILDTRSSLWKRYWPSWGGKSVLCPWYYSIYTLIISQERITSRIKIINHTLVNTLVIADNLVCYSAKWWQPPSFRLFSVKLASEWNIEISTIITKVMGFLQERILSRSKIIVNYTTIEQVTYYQYLGYDITYDNAKIQIRKLSDFTKNLNSAKILSIWKTLYRETRKESQK